MQIIVQLIVTTLQIGAVYVLFSLGLTLVFGVMRIVNFAHGQFFAISAMIVAVTIQMLGQAGLSVLPAYLLACIAGIGVALAVGTVLYAGGLRFFQRDMNGSFVLTIGVVLFVEGVMLEIFGGGVRPVPDIFTGTLPLLGAKISVQRLVLFIAAVIVTVLLYWVLARTKLGMALRAVAADHEAAMLQGIPYGRIALSGFLIAAGLAALAGALIAPVAAVSPALSADYIIKGFIAVIVGGLGGVPGAIAGALLIAFIETFGGFYIDPSSASIMIFVLVIAVLLAKPTGLFGNG